VCGCILFTRRESQQQAQRQSRELQGALHERDALRSRCHHLEAQRRTRGDQKGASTSSAAVESGSEESGSKSTQRPPSAAAAAEVKKNLFPCHKETRAGGTWAR